MKNKKLGFTLVELLIVITVICILVAVMIPVISGVLNKTSEQTDDVTAGLYSSVMQQFAHEKAGDAVLYPALSTTGSNSEYSVLFEKSGKGMYPGYNILEYDNDEDVYAAIRREAVIAIKAFSEIKTLDGYYVAAPTKEHYQYVYYYLTGEVRIEDETTKTPVNRTSVENGIINTEDYWVYLSRDGGSGEAVINTQNGTGMVFIQIRQYGTDKLLDDVTVTLNIGSEQMRAQTGSNGTVGFSGIHLGSVFVEAEKLGDISFPDSRFYLETGEIQVKNGSYIGDSAANPYVITLKMGTLGSLGFYQRTKTWDGVRWNMRDVYLTQNVDITSAFTVDTSREMGVARNETYFTNAAAVGGRQELLTTDGKFLLYGPYNMKITALNFRDYNEAVRSKVYGIDNYNNGGTGDFPNAGEPYEYPIIMKRPQGKGAVSGVIQWERSQQPLAGTSSAAGTWLTGYTDFTVSTRVKLVNKATGATYYSDYFAVNSSGNYPYTVSNLPDGTYAIYLDTPYGNSNQLKSSSLPDEVVIDGTEIVVNGRVYYEDVGTGTANATVTYDSRGNYDPIPGATVKFTRLGMPGYLQAATNNNGQATLTNVKRGFYQVTVTVPDYIGTGNYTYKIFVAGTENLIFRLPISPITVSGTIYGLKPNGADMDRNGSFDGLKLTLTRYNADGTKQYSAAAASVTTTGLNASYSINVVPGMYKLTTNVTCYLGYADAGVLRNFKTGTSFNFSLQIDGVKSNCHPTEKFYWKQDASYHWRECAKCGTVFDKAAHDPSPWTASGATGCYRYCKNSNCNRQLDPVTPHNYVYSAAESQAATCVTIGNERYKCSRCSYAKDVSLSKIGHYFSAWTSDGDSTHTRRCRNAGCRVSQTESHSFGNWYWVSQENQMSESGAYCYSTGTQRADCLTCGYYKLNSPKVAHAIESYMMRYYVNDDLYYNMMPSYTEAYFQLPSGRIYMRLGNKDNYSSRQVFAPINPDNGGYGFIRMITSRDSSLFTKSSVFNGTGHSHFIACSNRPSINGTPHYCYTPINHYGDPLRGANNCGCRNKPLGYVVDASGRELKPVLNPAWENPYAKYGR